MINENKRKAFEDLKSAIGRSISDRYKNEQLSIINFDVINKISNFSELGMDSKDLLSMLIEVIVELEAAKLAVDASQRLSVNFDAFIKTNHEAEKAADGLIGVATEGLYSLGEVTKTLRVALDSQPKELASKGGKGKKKKYEVLFQRSIELYESREWKSKRAAARAIESEIIALSAQVGVRLAGDQEWETIYNWIRKHTKR